MEDHLSQKKNIEKYDIFGIFAKNGISFSYKYDITEAVAQRCSVKKVFLEISQNSQENTCARVSFLIKLQPQTWWLRLLLILPFCQKSKDDLLPKKCT